MRNNTKTIKLENGIEATLYDCLYDYLDGVRYQPDIEDNGVFEVDVREDELYRDTPIDDKIPEKIEYCGSLYEYINTGERSDNPVYIESDYGFETSVWAVLKNGVCTLYDNYRDAQDEFDEFEEDEED